MHFNTSHVSINQCQGSAGASQVLISIHPMFLLINNPDADFTEPANFNTSHVSINPTSDPPPARHSSYFNTSHVSINLSFDEKVDEAKNISIHPMFLLIRGGSSGDSRRINFNTSHVSINQEKPCDDWAKEQFQYIPCFY